MFYKNEKKTKTSVSMKPSVYKLLSKIAKVKYPYGDEGNSFASMLLEELIITAADNCCVLFSSLGKEEQEVYLNLFASPGTIKRSEEPQEKDSPRLDFDDRPKAAIQEATESNPGETSDPNSLEEVLDLIGKKKKEKTNDNLGRN